MWFQIGLLIFSLLVVYFLTPKPEPLKPEQVEQPKSDQGAMIGVVLGSYWIEDSHVAWYGDVEKEAVRQSAK